MGIKTVLTQIWNNMYPKDTGVKGICEKILNITEYLTCKMHLATVTNYVLYQHNIISQTNIAVTRMDASYSTVQMHFLILCTYTDILWHIICVAWLASFKLKDSAMEDWGLLFLFHS